MSAVDLTQSTQQAVSGWASGAATFASVMLMLIGTFQVINGLTALFNDEFFIVGEQYTFKLDITVWGWLHLLLGLGLAFCGAGTVAARHVGGEDRDRASPAMRGRELLLLAVLPDVGGRRNRAGRLGDLGADPPGRHRHLTAVPAPAEL